MIKKISWTLAVCAFSVMLLTGCSTAEKVVDDVTNDVKSDMSNATDGVVDANPTSPNVTGDGVVGNDTEAMPDGAVIEKDTATTMP